MTWLKRKLKARYNLASDDATEIVKLPASGALSGLGIQVEWNNGSTGGRGVKMTDVVDSVEILANGDRPIISLNSVELLRWERYWSRQFDQLVVDEQASATQKWFMNIPFGMFMGDNAHYLPLNTFRDLELRIKYSPTIAADSGFATGTGYATITGYMRDDRPPGGFAGFFRTLHKKTFETVASGDNETELPLGHPYRAIMVYSHEAGVAMHTDISNVKIELNDGAIILMDQSTDDLVWENNSSLSLHPRYMGIHFSQAAETFETALDYLQAVSFQPGNVATIGTSATPLKLVGTLTGGLITPQGILKDGDATQAADIAENADLDYYVRADGVGLGKAVVIDFQDALFGDEPFDSNRYSKVKLALTQAGAGADTQISVSELVQTV